MFMHMEVSFRFQCLYPNETFPEIYPLLRYDATYVSRWVRTVIPKCR